MQKKSKAIKSYHTGTVKKSIKVNANKDVVWKKISNIVGLSSWVVGVKKTVFLSKKKRGIAAIRKITFEDGNNVEEHIVGWKNEKYFSYIAVSGLPLRAYHATISMKKIGPKSMQITWQSYFNSEKMSKKEFTEFVLFLGSFYRDSLRKLKDILEN